MARSVCAGFVLLVSTSLLLTSAWLKQAQAATYTIPWDLVRTRGVQPPDLVTRGDTIVFKWTDLAWHDLWIMDDEKAFKNCDFTRAKRLRPLVVGGQYTYKVTAIWEIFPLYFASSGILQCRYYKVKLSVVKEREKERRRQQALRQAARRARTPPTSASGAGGASGGSGESGKEGEGAVKEGLLIGLAEAIEDAFGATSEGRGEVDKLDISKAIEDAFGATDGGKGAADKLDISKLRTCFSYTGFWPTDSRPYGSGALFTGNLRAADVADARERLETKLAEGAGCPVAVFFLKDERQEKEVRGASKGIVAVVVVVTCRAAECPLAVSFLKDEQREKQVCIVQPVSSIDRRLALTTLTGLSRWPLMLLSLLGCLATTATVSGVNLDPYKVGLGESAHHALPLTLGLATVIGVGEVSSLPSLSRLPFSLSWVGCLATTATVSGVISTPIGWGLGSQHTTPCL
ncbi:unnamed protein product [Closterium sp. Naga37s-1]|nr:unnamed protein product [Closterium sp. Naga37s-1]